jgi:hypothetical protein
MVLMRIAELMRLPVSAIEQALAPLTARVSQGAHRTQASTALNGPIATTETLQAKPVREEIEIPRARRLAEFDLLSVIIYEPAAAMRLLEEVAGEIGSAGAMQVDRFLHPACRAIAAYIASRDDQSAGFTVQNLLAALEDEDHKRTASRLYFDGQRVCGDDGEHLEAALRTAFEALDRCIQREHLHDAVAVGAAETEDPVGRLREILDHRRKAGSIASAIGRGVRT